MSDEWGHEGTAVVDEAPGQGPTAGALLRRAREAAGLHVAALAVSLKVPVRKLEALEEDRYDLMPDVVFVRGLASSVCRTLKIDPSPILDRLPQTSAPRLVRDDDGINTPFRAPGDGAPPTWTAQLGRPVILVVIALLLGALALFLLPVSLHDDTAKAPARNEVAGMPPLAAIPAPDVPVATESTPVATPEPAPPAPVAAVPAPVAPANVPASLRSAAPGAAAATNPVPAPSSVPASPATANGIVVFVAKGPSWVEVTDAKGVVAVRKVLAAGESTGASGALPLHVTVGRTDLTDVQVRGKPFDLRPVSRDNVARFDVK